MSVCHVHCVVKTLYDIGLVTWNLVWEILIWDYIWEGSYGHYFKFCIVTWTQLIYEIEYIHFGLPVCPHLHVNL